VEVAEVGALELAPEVGQVSEARISITRVSSSARKLSST
jgi:hypothetical protein